MTTTNERDGNTVTIELAGLHRDRRALQLVLHALAELETAAHEGRHLAPEWFTARRVEIDVALTTPEEGEAATVAEFARLVAASVDLRADEPAVPTDRRESVVQGWVAHLPWKLQTLLLLALRGCDTESRHGPTKAATRALRGVVLKQADNRTGFIRHDLPPLDMDAAEAKPWHWLSHLMDAAKVVAALHPDAAVRATWTAWYHAACRRQHVHPQPFAEFAARLRGDNGPRFLEDAAGFDAAAPSALVPLLEENFKRPDARFGDHWGLTLRLFGVTFRVHGNPATADGHALFELRDAADRSLAHGRVSGIGAGAVPPRVAFEALAESARATPLAPIRVAIVDAWRRAVEAESRAATPAETRLHFSQLHHGGWTLEVRCGDRVFRASGEPSDARGRAAVALRTDEDGLFAGGYITGIDARPLGTTPLDVVLDRFYQTTVGGVVNSVELQRAVTAALMRAVKLGAEPHYAPTGPDAPPTRTP